MNVPTWDVLPADSGRNLPVAVRAALVDMGNASNQIALALNHANLIQAQAMTATDAANAQAGPHSSMASASDDITECALSFINQLIVVYAKTTTTYAVYVTRVAADLAAGREPATPDSSAVVPSQVLSDFEQFLPVAQVSAAHLAQSIVDDHNAQVTAARQRLTNLTTMQLFDTPVDQYDDPAAVATRPRGSLDLVTDFPAELHAYAATLMWAIAVVTGGAD
jgi:hypothetical protein